MTDEIQAAATEKTPEQLRAEAAEPAKPLDQIAKAEQGNLNDSGVAEQPVDTGTTMIGADPSPGANLADPPREVPAAERLRAFEDRHLGKDAVRIGGRIERGSGSPFAAMSDEKKRQYAALEKLVAAEQKLADAHAALIQAEADHEAALAATEPKPDAGE